MNSFLTAIIDECGGKLRSQKSLLLHSTAWLSETEMGADAAPGESWFNAKKRGLLAPFAVGTIDQALMAVMNVKHNFVRAFGLAGKVVILDEVHSYDTYTGTVIDKLIDLLREMNCTVIILSATLTDERRKEILSHTNTSDSPHHKTSYSPYPLVSAAEKNDAVLKEIPVPITDSLTVTVSYTYDEDAIFENVLLRAENGEQILWIENTVDEAQDLYIRIASRAAECTIETGLLHSRFTQDDRNKNEEYWVGLYGKDGKLHRCEKGRILVGTQVLEQSLDIDADLLVTRICPSDMLLQRIGRLWRHRENDALRPKDVKPTVCILSPDYDDALCHKNLMGKTAFVYAPYILFRTMEVWKAKEKIHLPNNIRSIVEETYFERNDVGVLAKLKSDLLKKKSKLQSLARLGISKFGTTSSDMHAKTRYSEIETNDVLLLRDVKYLESSTVSITLPSGDEVLLEPGIRFSDKKEWRHRAARLTRALVRVPINRLPGVLSEKKLPILKEYMWTEDLCVAIVTENDEIVGLDGTSLATDYKLTYTSKIGYRAQKQKDVKDDYDDEW
jgi:CRISPR-associated endonuclease/helicase Cas3